MKILGILAMTFLSFPMKAANDFCSLKNRAFLAGESITLKVYYSLGVSIAAGEATFNTSIENLNGKPVYHIVGEGRTYPFYDNFFRVRDRYETYIDTATLKPYKFIRNVDEGGYKKFETVSFNHNAKTAVTGSGAFKVPDCTQDIISAIYNARNLDFSKYKVNDKIPFTMFLDNEIYNMYIRYMGKETIKTKYGKFRAIKFKPLLVKGSVFEGGEKMTVWVSDDGNKIPLRIESQIAVGSIKVDMASYRNLRYPLSSLISVR